MMSSPAWNHPRRPLVLLPVLYVVGSAIGHLGGVHLVTTLQDDVVALLFGTGTILLGGAALALVN